MDFGKTTTAPGGWKFTYNAPFTLSFCLVSLAFLLLNVMSGGAMNMACCLLPEFSVFGLYRFVTYIFCHANWEHLISNSLYLLLLGPLLEEKYGTRRLLYMTLITAIVTGILNVFLFRQQIIGASGIVFMFIILSSLVNMQRREIPLTFVLVTVVFLGNELVQSFGNDQISQFAHILGGLCGAALGFANRN